MTNNVFFKLESYIGLCTKQPMLVTLSSPLFLSLSLIISTSWINCLGMWWCPVTMLSGVNHARGSASTPPARRVTSVDRPSIAPTQSAARRRPTPTVCGASAAAFDVNDAPPRETFRVEHQTSPEQRYISTHFTTISEYPSIDAIACAIRKSCPKLLFITSCKVAKQNFT